MSRTLQVDRFERNRHLLGTTLAHFKITAKLGEGGMGEVYWFDELERLPEVQ